MKHLGKYISHVFVVILTGMVLNSCATPTPKPVGELSFNAATSQMSSSPDRDAAIERVRNALCAIEATIKE